MNFIFLQQTSNLITNCVLPLCFVFTHFARAFPVSYCKLSRETSLRTNRRLKFVYGSVRVATPFWKTDHLHTKTEIHLLPVRDRHTHALSRNTKYQTIDCQVCFYRRLFADAVKPRGCNSWSWGALIGLHGVPNCSSRQFGPPWWIASVHATY